MASRSGFISEALDTRAIDLIFVRLPDHEILSIALTKGVHMDTLTNCKVEPQQWGCAKRTRARASGISMLFLGGVRFA